MERLEFVAVLAPIQSAVKIHPEGGGRLIFDVDDQSLRRIWPVLPDWRDILLRVTVEPMPGAR